MSRWSSRGTARAVSATLVDRFELRVGGVNADVGIFEAPLGSARALLVDEPSLFDRDHLYATETGDYPDNARRFAVLVRAALEFAIRRGARPTSCTRTTGRRGWRRSI